MKRIIGLLLLGAVLYSCGTSSNVESQASGSQDRPGEILVDLKDGIKADVISNRLKKYGLEQSKVVSPSLNIVLFKFNEQKIELGSLIEKVKKMDEVENAQSNKNLHNRNY